MLLYSLCLQMHQSSKHVAHVHKSTTDPALGTKQQAFLLGIKRFLPNCSRPCIGYHDYMLLMKSALCRIPCSCGDIRTQLACQPMSGDKRSCPIAVGSVSGTMRCHVSTFLYEVGPLSEILWLTMMPAVMPLAISVAKLRLDRLQLLPSDCLYFERCWAALVPIKPCQLGRYCEKVVLKHD